MTIDTACSSSLVAVHEAVQQLRSGGSKVAIAAGTNLILSPCMLSDKWVIPGSQELLLNHKISGML